MAITCCGAIYAKDSVEVSTKEYTKTEAETEPKGKAIIAVFTNFNTTFDDGISKCAFGLDRSYIGYQYSLGNGLELKAVLDVGKPDEINDYHYVAYIKIAQIT